MSWSSVILIKSATGPLVSEHISFLIFYDLWTFVLKLENVVWKTYFEISLEIWFGYFVWKSCLEISFGYFVWKIRLEILFGKFVWKFCCEISFGNFVWKICLEDRPTDRPTDRQTERLLEAPSRSLKMTPKLSQNQMSELKDTQKIKVVALYE